MMGPGRHRKGTVMACRVKVVCVAAVAALCVSLVSSCVFAGSPEILRDLRPDEIEKIKAALPEKTTKEAPQRKMLVFWRCEGFFHTVIPVANEALRLMGEKTGAYTVVTTDDPSVFTIENLKQFDAICFNNSTGLKFSPETTPGICKAIMDFVKVDGKGIVGIHAAADNFGRWEEARKMMGNSFTGHPWGAGGTWAIKIDQPDHPLTAAFKGQGFKVKDEIYRTDAPLYTRENQFVLMSLDMSDPATKNVGGLKPSDDDTGITWIKDWGKGRVFYCSLGHNDEIFYNAAILRHYLDGIQFAFGDYPVDTKPKP